MKIIVTDLNGRELSDVKFKVEFTQSEMDLLKYPDLIKYLDNLLEQIQIKELK
jgi:hypothetical protein